MVCGKGLILLLRILHQAVETVGIYLNRPGGTYFVMVKLLNDWLSWSVLYISSPLGIHCSYLLGGLSYLLGGLGPSQRDP